MEGARILFLDTETTGTGSFDRVVQLAWSFLGSDNDFIIRPDNYVIPDAAIALHGISTSMALEKGRPIKDVLVKFMSDIDKADIICAHNLPFDKGKLLYEMSLLGDEGAAMAQAFNDKPGIDTMRIAKYFVGARTSNGRIKNPTLTELHTKLFSSAFPAHNAMSDVKALERCFNGLMDNNVIVL
jgi:DNA polymerase-3 subunit alpha